MNDVPLIRISPFIAICLCLTSAVALAQYGIYHSAEPPLADSEDGIQQVAGQSPLPGVTPAGVPAVAVTVTGPPFVTFNKDLTYRIIVQNVSSVHASNVHVLHPLNGAKLVKCDPDLKDKPADGNLDWHIGPMQPGERKQLELTVTPSADKSEFSAIAKVRYEHGRELKIKIAKPEVAIKLSVPKEIQQSDIVPARLELTNPSPLEVKDIQVSVALPEGFAHQYDPTPPGQTADPKNVPQMRTWTVPRLGPNEMRVLDFRLVGARNGPAKIESLALPSNGPRAALSTDVSVQPPRLEITATGPGQRPVHQSATYRVAVKNAGNYVMRNVKVTDQLPAQCDVISASDGGQQFDRQVQWIVPLLNPGETRVLEITTRNTAAGGSTHQFEAVYRKAVQQTAVTTSFESTAAVRIDFSGSLQTVDVGGTVRYVMTVENNGSAPATNVRPVIALPDSMTIVNSEPMTVQQIGGRVAFDSTTVPAGGRATFTVTAKAVRATSPAIVTAELTANELEAGVVRRQETTAIVASYRP